MSFSIGHGSPSHLSTSGMSYQPNFPVKEPVFYVPRLPDLIKVPEPQPPKRPPAPGYDMKTLRRQLEFLTQEMDDRTRSQQQVCKQNEQLWGYIQELLEANKFNANAMREHVHGLNDELRRAHKERYVLAERLSTALSSKKMLDDLSKELADAELTTSEMEQRKREAEEHLHRVKRERQRYEETLKEKLHEMTEFEDDLDRFRSLQKEEDAIDKADDFFFTNKTVLKAAYARFRGAVKERMRHTRIQTYFKSMYSKHLKTSCFQLWLSFLHRKHVMKHNQNKRKRELLRQCWMSWKVSHSIDKYSKYKQRHYLLTTCFQMWQSYTKDCQYDTWAKQQTIDWKCLVLKRKIFNTWKRDTVFLSWHNPDIEQKDLRAQKFYKKRIFLAWKRVYRRTSMDLDAKSETIMPGLFMLTRFKAWHTLCLRKWRWRGKLLRRFFKHSRANLARCNSAAVRAKVALKGWIAYHKRQCLRTWRKYAKLRSKLRLFVSLSPKYRERERERAISNASEMTPRGGLSLSLSLSMLHSTNGRDRERGGTFTGTTGIAYSERETRLMRESQRILSHYHRRQLRSAFLQAWLTLSVLRRQRVSRSLATRHYLVRLARLGLSHWRISSRRRHSRRCVLESSSLSRAWLRLKVSLGREKERRRIERRNEQSLAFARTHSLNTALDQWRALVTRRRCLSRCEDSLSHRLTYRITGRTFSLWKTRWTKNLYWRYQSLSIDFQRVTALHELDARTMEDYQIEREKLEQQNSELEETVFSLQELLAEKKNDCDERAVIIREREGERDSLLGEVQTLRRTLHEAEQERDRWAALERSLVEERSALEREREKRAREMAERVAAMEREAARMRASLLDEISVLDDDCITAEEETKQGLQSLDRLIEETERSEQLLFTKTIEVDNLEKEQEVLFHEVDKMQKKVKNVAEEGDGLRQENEKLLRERLSELRVLRSDAGVAQARVHALYGVLDEYEKGKSKMQLNEIESHDDQELNELRLMKQKFEEQMRVFKERSSVVMGSPHRDNLLQSLVNPNAQSPLVTGPSSHSLAHSIPRNQSQRGNSVNVKTPAMSSSSLTGSESENEGSLQKVVESSVSTERDFQDARETIRLLSHRLRSTFMSATPQSPSLSAVEANTK